MKRSSSADEPLLRNGKKAKAADHVLATKTLADADAIDLDGLNVAELRALLEERGLSTTGAKKTLCNRLSEALNSETTQNEPEEDNIVPGNGNECDGGFNVIKNVDELTVAELRAELQKRGISTAGSKKTLYGRLSEALNCGKAVDALEKDDIKSGNDKNCDDKSLVANGKKQIKTSDRDSTNNNIDSDEIKIDGFTMVELRAALDKRGLSTAGTKKTLHGRLSEALKKEKVEDTSKNHDLKADDGKENNGTENEEKEKKTARIIKKGRAVLDDYLPDNVKFQYHVMDRGGDIYDALLNQTNVRGNNNKFYIIQVLEPDSGSGPYLVYNRWGRVGVKGQNKIFNFSSISEAISEFEAKFYDKTFNFWENRHHFLPVKNKYTWLERDYNEDDEVAKSMAKKTEKRKNFLEDSKLDLQLARFISLICNIDMMKQHMLEIGYDATQLPLGRLSKATILKGYECLKRIAAVLDGSAKESLEQLSSDFYTVIPHDFGFQKMSSFIVDTPQKLKRKLEMVEALGEIQLATTLLQDVDEEDDPLYNRYKQLNCHLQILQHDSEEFQWITQYLHTTHAKTHDRYTLEVIEIFKVKRDVEQKHFEKFETTNNRMLLWHGSRLTNWTGILSQGLRIAPPEAPVSGYMFGKGVYFADMVSKSANYCYTSWKDPVGVLLLCEVALGDMWELQHANYDANNLPPGKLSTKGVGSTEPDSKDFKVLPDGLIIPMGKPVEKKQGGSLLYNEYIVYDVTQIKMRYVLQVKFNYH